MKKLISKYWPILLIFLLVVIFAFPWWAKGLVPFPSTYLVTSFPPWQYYFGMPVKNSAMPDVVTQMYPWKHLVIELWKKGQVPLWNPYNFSGSPFLANYQSAVFHPANFLFFLLPQITAWSLLIFLQPLLAGIFTYLFARQLKISQAPSLVCAISFMFCGFITCWAAYGTMSYALLFLPLILWAIEKSFSKLHFWSLSIISLALAASFLSGHFQISLYVLFTSLAYLAFKYLLTHDFKKLLIGFLFLILGLGLAAPQILPAFELYRLSSRSQTLAVSEIIPFRYLITLIAPDFYGNDVTRNRFLGNYAEWMGFAGVIPLILAIYIIFRKRTKTVNFFLLLGLVSLIMTLPTPILDFIVRLRIPVLSSSAASRIIALFSFSVAMLAGFGFERLIQDLKERRFKAVGRVATGFLILIAAIWLILFLGKPFSTTDLNTAKRNFILPSGLVLSFALLVYGCSLLKLKTLRFAIPIILLLLTVFDLFRFANKWFPFDSKEYVYPSLPILEFLSKKTPPDRVFGFMGMEMQNYFGIQGFDGYDPVFIQRYGELLLAADDGKIKLPSVRGVGLAKRGRYTMNLLNLMGGKYFIHAFADDRKVWVFPYWEKPEQFKEVFYEENKYQVFENLAAYPRAFMVYDYTVIDEPQKIIDTLFSSQTNLRKTLVLEEKPDLEKLSNLDSPRFTAEIIDYSPNQVRIKVDTERTGLLFLSDNYYPGWVALVDGKASKIYRADYTFRAVAVPQGNHQVDFIYQPQSFKIGLGLSMLSGLLILAGGIIISKNENRHL